MFDSFNKKQVFSYDRWDNFKKIKKDLPTKINFIIHLLIMQLVKTCFQGLESITFERFSTIEINFIMFERLS